MKLRNYQEDGINSIRQAIMDGHRHVIFSMATGGGKTRIAKAIVDGAVGKHKRVLFTAHRKELVYQTFETMDRPAAISVSMGGEGAYDKELPIQLGSLQTIAKRIKQYGKAYLGEIDIIIMDEIHWGYKSAMQNQIFDVYGNDTIIIGLSATPIDERGYRLDGFDLVIDKYQTEDLIAMGYLVAPECFAPQKPNLTGVRMQGGDYAIDAIADIMDKKAIVSNLYEIWIKYAAGLKTIVFGVNIGHVENIYREFTHHGIPAGIIHSKITPDEREETLNKLKTGKITVIVNCEVLTTGFDEPTLECLIMARPTQSVRLAMQCWGRVLRISPGKSQALILDTAGVIQDTGYPTMRRNFNREKPPKGKKKKKETQADTPECSACHHTVDPMKRHRSVEESDTAIETTYRCPYCSNIMSVNVIDKQAKELERIEEAKKEADDKIIYWNKMTNQYGGYKELQKIAKKAGYKPGWSWLNAKAITEANLWTQAAQVFMRCDGMGLAPTEAIKEIRAMIGAIPDNK